MKGRLAMKAWDAIFCSAFEFWLRILCLPPTHIRFETLEAPSHSTSHTRNKSDGFRITFRILLLQVASALQLTTILAESIFQSRYDICRPADLRVTLFELLQDLYRQDLILSVHATVSPFDVSSDVVRASPLRLFDGFCFSMNFAELIHLICSQRSLCNVESK